MNKTVEDYRQTFNIRRFSVFKVLGCAVEPLISVGCCQDNFWKILCSLFLKSRLGTLAVFVIFGIVVSVFGWKRIILLVFIFWLL